MFKHRVTNFIILHRQKFSLVMHLILAGVAFVLSFLIRFDFYEIPDEFFRLMMMALPIAVGIKGFAVIHYGLTSGLWRYVGINDLLRIIKACVVSSAALIISCLLVFGHGFPRSIYVLDFMLTVILFGGVRFSIRLSRESLMPALQSSAGKRTLIIGAGDAGEIALRSLMKDYMGIYHVVGFLDDDPAKQKMAIHGYPILGKVSDAARIVHDENITEVLIAISQAPKEFIKSIVESCTGRNVNFRIMPAIKSFMTGEVQIEKIRKVKLEDLLGREPVKLDRDAVAKQLSGKCVLVTGAGGSIGSEIARQVAGYAPTRLVLLDFAESALFEIDRAIREDYPDVDVIPCLVDIRQTEDVNAVFKELTPHRVFHAAAYKHVPLMEQHPMDAVRTNVIGTENLANAAITNNVEKFVMISTDKAVRPSSVMGATKRICELVVARRGTKSRTIFAAVRFGNVLGSNGSVIPIFEKQIAKGGPVRVTDPNMTRYFMTIPEAVELVLQASVLSTSNDVFVLDMGTPVKIIDLATNMIELSGMIVDEDIKIEIMGPRPGEKTHEELVTYGEQLLTTSIDKISLLCKEDMIPGGKDFETNLKRLKKMAIDRRRKETLKYIWDIIEADRKNANHTN